MSAGSRQFRKALIVSATLGVAMMSCGREPTGPGGASGVVRHSQGIAFNAEFPAGYAAYQQASQASGSGGVTFTTVRVVLRNADGTIALDTTVNFPAGADSLPVVLNVPLPASAPASGVPLAMTLDYMDATGATVFTGGPVNVNAVPSVPGAGPPPPSPVNIVLSYVGPGSTAAGVRISPTALTVNTGGSFSFSAQAVDAAGNTMTGVPIVFVSEDGVLAQVNPLTGAGTAGSSRGNTRIVAQLLTHQEALATLTIVAPPASIAAVSGSGQSANVNAQLANPVVVQVNATDGQPAAGVTVSFAAQNGGSVGSASVVTGANGQAQTTWRLGGTAGAQALTASATGLAGSPVTFAAIANPLQPVRLVFLQQPLPSISAGSTLSPPITVQAVDALGAVTNSFTGPVTLTFGPTSPPGAILAGATTVNAVAGTATFNDLRINTPGGYTLVAASPPLISATSDAFVIVAGAANRLVFQAYPVIGAQAGAVLDPITVAVRDAIGNPVTNYTGAVTLTASAAAASSAEQVPGATADIVLTGPVTVNAVAGVATFTNLQINTAGSYTLSASGTDLLGTTGPVFPITAGPASSLTLSSGGGQSAAGGAVLAAPVIVRVSDGFGNGIAGVTVNFTPAGGSGSVNPVSAVSGAGGLAQTTWTIGGLAGAQTLNVSGAGLSPNPLVVNATATTTTAAGPATQLVFTQQPGNTAMGAPITPAVQVTAKDAGGLVATSFTGSVTIDIAVNPSGGTLAGTTTVAAVAGIATFPGLSIDITGIGYQLGAMSAPLPAAVSASFDITGGAIAWTSLNSNLDSLYSFGDFVTKVATSYYANESVAPGVFTWLSRNPAVATVNSSGLVTAVANGSTYVVVTEAGGTKDSALVVVQQRVATINVTPGTRNIYKTRTFQFTAAAVDGRGNVMPAITSFTWTTIAPAIASSDANGLVTGVSLGGTQVRATANSITGVAAVTVLTPITRIIVGRDSSGVPVTDTTALPSLGIHRSMRAEARDTLDAPMTGVTFTWFSTNGSVALLDSLFATRATALSNANGNTAIQATADGIMGSAPLKVQQVLSSVELTPTPDTIGITGTVQLTARGKDANNRYITGGSFTYASDNTPVATVNATTGVVSGVALGTANVTATSGAITSNQAVIVVASTVPPIISFGLDTLTVGRGAAKSIPIFLSRPNGTNVVVNLAARDTNAYFSVASITFTPGQTALNVTLNGRNAGTTELYALDGSGNGYKGDTAVVAIQANLRFAQTGWSLNSTDQVATQVLLSDPSPAGGTFVTFTYGTAGRAQVSPDPAFIPTGQLASNVVITAMGATNGNTTITPVATGVNGTPSTMTVYAPTLTISAGATGRLGAGQFQDGWYVYTQVNTNVAVPLTYVSTDTSIVTVSPATGAIPGGSYYQYFTVYGKAPGTAKVIITATDWRPDTLTMTVTSPRLDISGQTSFNTTSPQTSLTVYAEDSLGTAHYRTSSLALSVSSSDTSVIKVIDQSPVIPAGQYYVSGVRYQPGGSGGTAWVKVTAGGHAPDSMLVTVVGPKLQFSWGGTPHVGKGQYNANVYVYTPNNVVAPLTVTFTNSNAAKVTIPDSVTIPTGLYYAYFNVIGLDTGLVSFIASAPGYQPDTAQYRVSSPRVDLSGGGTRNAFSPPSGFTLYSTDSLGSAHTRSTPLAVSLRSTDTTVITVDSATVTIRTDFYYHNTARVLAVGTGTAYLVAEAPGHRPDSVLYTVQTPKLNFSWNTILLGRRQYRASTDYYLYVPDNRTTPLSVTVTQSSAAVDSLNATAHTIPVGLYYSYIQPHGLANGIDTLIASAPGYLPDTAYVRVTTPRLRYVGGLPSNAATTNSPVTVTLYAADSVNNGHYSMDTLVIRAVSSDTTVIKPTQQYFRLIKGNYYVQPQIQYIGPGSASITYSDSAGSGYLSTTTNTVTVTGPTLVFSNTNARYGMRQRGSSTDYYVYTQNNVASPVTVNLVSSAPVVATVPATVTIPTGSYYAYFTITAQDTVGTIQITANASGYGPPATPITVTVTQPKFVISTNANPRTTSGPQTITIYATDDNGNSHYVTENVSVNVASSSGAVFTTDSSTATIVSGNYYTQAAKLLPVGVGSAQLSASDPRAAIYKYNTGTANINVTTPNLNFSWSNVTIGLGQYIDQSYYCCYYVSTPDNQVAATTVTLGHAGSAKTSVPATVTIPASLYYSYFRINATALGVDTLTAAIASPFHRPDTTYVTVDSGTVVLSGWPGSLGAVGDSVLVTLQTRNPAGGTNMRNTAATTFALAPNASIEFRQANAVVTAVTVPADGSQVTFYVKAIATGAGTATITNANYKTLSPPSITIP